MPLGKVAGRAVEIVEDLTFGLDLGIASCGWAVIRGGDGAGEIVKIGTWMFDAPETAKERTPTNQLRRTARGMRRVLRRRAQRMSAVRRLFKEHGLLTRDDKDALAVTDHGAPLDPWGLRAKGLDRRLTGPEFGVALGHIAKHRGFKSNSKRDRGANATKDSSAMLGAIAANQQKQATWRSVGEMFFKDEAFAGRKRNRDGEYTRSILRSDQEKEVRLLFDVQRRAGNSLATPELEAAFLQTAFFQRPLADSEGLVGACPFEPGEKRAAKHAWSFELFRLLSRLAAIRIGKDEHALTPDQMGRVEAVFGQRPATITWKALRKLIGLPDDQHFAGVKREDEKNDFVSRQGVAARGANALREAVAERAGELAWGALRDKPETLDAIAFVLTFRDDVNSIRAGLVALNLDPSVLAALTAGVEQGDFSGFKGAAHISAKAARKMIPFLRQGMVYSDAAKAAGYDHAARPEGAIEAVANPVARKALTEGYKQVKAMIAEWGLAGRIHVELAREVGKSKDERDEITRGLEKRNKERERLRARFEEQVLRPSANPADLQQFELWEEQNGECLYCGAKIDLNLLTASDNSVQVDHILPWSRFGDDSFVNKTLCHTACNQRKKRRTPFEWMVRDERDELWFEGFRGRVEGLKWMKGRKKRNYVLKNAAEVEDKFRSRNLNDTRYAARVLADELKRLYDKSEDWRVRGRPGPLTDRLRRGWGIQDLKKDEEGARRSDDRHHALDALICAATSDSAMIRLTRAFQESEERGSHRDFENLEPPWPGFVEEARRHVREAFVARAERRRARGEAHAATVRQIAERDGREIVYERKPVANLTLGDLDRLKDPERNAGVQEALRAWIDDGKPTAPERLPRSPKGDVIGKVRLATNKKVDVLIRDGAAERGEMVRVDVFRKQNKRGAWENYLVPIYPHQVADGDGWPTPPSAAIVAFKGESDWVPIDENFEFAWSIYPLSYLELEKGDGTVLDGYFRGLDRQTGNIAISLHRSKDVLMRGLGPRTLKSFRKYAVDRLGRRFPIEREKRTWRGAVCT